MGVCVWLLQCSCYLVDWTAAGGSVISGVSVATRGVKDFQKLPGTVRGRREVTLRMSHWMVLRVAAVSR